MACVVGTVADPQDRRRQVAALAEAGAEVHLSNAAATRRAIELLGGSAMTTAPTSVITAGAAMFGDAVAAQAVDVTSRRLAAADARHRGRPGRGARRPAAPRRQRDRRWPRCSASRPMLVDVAPAAELLGLEPGQFLHAGPPIAWDRASGPLRGALMGGAALEGLVDDPEDAAALFESGSTVSLDPCHHHGTVGPMAGVVTPSMWMFVLEDPATGRRTHCSLNEGLGKVLRYGAYGPEVLDPAALDARRARPAAADGRARDRSRWTSPASSPRCSRWATRRTTATAPAP